MKGNETKDIELYEGELLFSADERYLYESYLRRIGRDWHTRNDDYETRLKVKFDVERAVRLRNYERTSHQRRALEIAHRMGNGASRI